jgi:transcriptional regulator with XRE-family HTH domain
MPRRREGDENNILRSFRELRGLTQQEASEIVGISRTLWSAWEGKNRPMSLAHLNRIRTALQLEDVHILSLLRWWEEACFEENLPNDQTIPVEI